MTWQRTKVWSEDQLRCLLDMLVKLPDSLLEGGRLIDSHVDARVYFVLFTLLPSLTLGPYIKMRFCFYCFGPSVLCGCAGGWRLRFTVAFDGGGRIRSTPPKPLLSWPLCAAHACVC